MTRDEKCRKCRGLLFSVVPLPPDGKYWLMYEKTKLALESDETDHFFKCLHCGAKNIVTTEPGHEGESPRYEIISWK